MGAVKDFYLELGGLKPVEIPEWKTTIFVGPLTIKQFQRIEAAMLISDSERNVAVIAACAKKENGAPMFGEVEIEEIRNYGTTAVVMRVAGDITRAMPAGTFPEAGADGQGVTNEKKS